MKKAEQEARKRKDGEIVEIPETTGFDEIKPVEGIKLSVWNGVIPILTLVIGALIAFYWSGYTNILSGENTVLITLMKQHLYHLMAYLKHYQHLILLLLFSRPHCLLQLLQL